MKMRVRFQDGEVATYDLPADFDPSNLHSDLDLAVASGKFLRGQHKAGPRIKPLPVFINPRWIAEIRIIP